MDDSSSQEVERSFDAKRIASLLGTCDQKWSPNESEHIGHCWCYKLPLSRHKLPKRLLEIGKRGEWPLRPRLILTADLETSSIQYAALSHVWGNISSAQKENMSTTPSSLNARLKGSNFASFPEHFKAVIILCRCLEIRYLWIDALCIIQVCCSHLLYFTSHSLDTGRRSGLGRRRPSYGKHLWIGIPHNFH